MCANQHHCKFATWRVLNNDVFRQNHKIKNADEIVFIFKLKFKEWRRSVSSLDFSLFTLTSTLNMQKNDTRISTIITIIKA